MLSPCNGKVMTAIFRGQAPATGLTRPGGEPGGEPLSLRRVQYGWYRDGTGKHAPLWAYSIAQLNEEERERAELLTLLWPADAERLAKLRAQYARLRSELLRQTESYERLIVPQKQVQVPPQARDPVVQARDVPPPAVVPEKPAISEQRATTPPADTALPAHAGTIGAKIAELRKELTQPEQIEIPPPAAAKRAAPAEPQPVAPMPPPVVAPKKPPKPVATARPTASPRPAQAPRPTPKRRRLGLMEELRQAVHFKAAYRSRRPRPACGKETHFVASLSTVVSGLYRRVCKSRAYREPTLVKIHKVDKPGFTPAE